MKFTPSTGLAALALATSAAAQDVCPNAAALVAPTAYVYPVYISTYIAAATVININGSVDITVNNGPTTIETIVFATSTQIETVTTTATTTALLLGPTTTTIAEPIILGIDTTTATKRRANGLSSFVGGSANAVGSCQQAQPLSLTGGALFTTGGLQFSVSLNVVEAPFAASATAGSITGQFGVNDNFVWINPSFVGGEALFCITGAGAVNAIFDGAFPTGCVEVTFFAILASSCPGLGSNSTSSTASIGSATSTVASLGLSSSTGIPPISANGTTGSTSASVPLGTGIISSVLTGASSVITPSISAVPSISINSTSSSSSTNTASTTSFQVGFPAPTSATKKRQTTLLYFKADGTTTDDPSQAATYSLVGTDLFVDGLQLSTNTGTTYQQFEPLLELGDITTSFELGSSLSWANESFTLGNGEAVFAFSSSTVYAAFATIPPGADVISLVTIPASSSATSSSAVTTSSVSSVSGGIVTSASGSSPSSNSVLSTTSSSSSSSMTSSTSVASVSPTTTQNATENAMGKRYMAGPRRAGVHLNY